MNTPSGDFPTSQRKSLMAFLVTAFVLQTFFVYSSTNVVRNPFKFVELYNRAARKNGNAQVLSPKALAYIRSLESLYANQEGTRSLHEPIFP